MKVAHLILFASFDAGYKSTLGNVVVRFFTHVFPMCQFRIEPTAISFGLYIFHPYISRCRLDLGSVSFGYPCLSHCSLLFARDSRLLESHSSRIVFYPSALDLGPPFDLQLICLTTGEAPHSIQGIIHFAFFFLGAPILHHPFCSDDFSCICVAGRKGDAMGLCFGEQSMGCMGGSLQASKLQRTDTAIRLLKLLSSECIMIQVFLLGPKKITPASVSDTKSLTDTL